MTKGDSIQQTMFRELKDKSLFDKAQSYAYEYIDNVFERNVYPTEHALEGLQHFERPLPAETGNAAAIIDELNTYGSPATVAHLGGRYFGFVTGGAVPVGLAAKSLATFWDQNSVLHVLSPICSTLESVVEQWLVQLFGLPEATAAGFVSGTFAANFSGLAAARYRVLKNNGWDVNEQGLFNAPRVRIVIGRDAHSTVIKALGLLGFGKNNFEWVDVDDQGRMIPKMVPALDKNSIVILQAGNVNSGLARIRRAAFTPASQPEATLPT